MGSIENKSREVFNVTPNIVMSIDDNNMGEMYIYEGCRKLIFNGITASDLVDYFYCNDKHKLSEEIFDVIMNMTINKGTH